MRNKRIPHSVDDADIKQNAKDKFKYDEDAAKRLTKFAITLNRLMQEKGIDQIQMANELNISVGALSNYRNGKNEPGLTKIIQMAEYLGVDCSYLMTGIQSKNYALHSDLGLSNSAINLLLFLNKENSIDQGRSISFLNRVLSDSKNPPNENTTTLFYFLESYVRSSSVERQIDREYSPSENDSIEKIKQELFKDELARKLISFAVDDGSTDIIGADEAYKSIMMKKIVRFLDSYCDEYNEQEANSNG